MKLDSWLEQLVVDFNLKKTINFTRKKNHSFIKLNDNSLEK